MTRAHNLWENLPIDVRVRIERHGAATVIQRNWLTWSLTAHTRNGAWCAVLSRILPYFSEFVLYENIRREWRTECESWLDISPHTLAIIRQEVEESLWGYKSTRIHVSQCRSESVVHSKIES